MVTCCCYYCRYFVTTCRRGRDPDPDLDCDDGDAGGDVVVVPVELAAVLVVARDAAADGGGFAGSCDVDEQRPPDPNHSHYPGPDPYRYHRPDPTGSATWRSIRLATLDRTRLSTCPSNGGERS